MKIIFWTLYYYLQAIFRKRFKSRIELKKWQDKKVRLFFKKTLSVSKYYSGLYEGLKSENWRDFPAISKKEMMENFDILNTVGITREQALDTAMKGEKTRDFSGGVGDITVGLSSGTSGNKGIFIASEAERFRWAGTVLAKVLPRPVFVKQKIAFFLRANSGLYETVNSGRIKFEFFDLFDNYDRHLSRLNIYMPSTLVGPPSMLRMLAGAKAGGLLAINPEKIVSVAEVLEPGDKAYIEKQFGIIVHQVYQATEGFLGVTCKYGVIHLNEDLLCVQKEYVDEESGRFIPVITDFSRTSQPIIRYRLNDILVEKKGACKCGSVFTALESIEGRTDDVFYMRAMAGKEDVAVFPDFIRRAVITADDEIEEYEVVQKSRDFIEVSIKCPDASRNRIYDRLAVSFKELAGAKKFIMPEIVFKQYERSDNTRKLRRVSREFLVNGL